MFDSLQLRDERGRFLSETKPHDVKREVLGNPAVAAELDGLVFVGEEDLKKLERSRQAMIEALDALCPSRDPRFPFSDDQENL